jgi:hypothetical protein
MAEAARVVYRLPSPSCFLGRCGAKLSCAAAMATRLISGVAVRNAFGYAVAHRRGEPFYDLSAVPQRRLLSLASFRNDGFCVHARRVPAVALPHVRPEVLFLAGRAELFPFRPLPPMRKFRSGAYFARPRGGWDDVPRQAASAFSCLSLRSLPGAILQHPPGAKDTFVHAVRDGTQRPRGGGWRELTYSASTALLPRFSPAWLPRTEYPIVTQN